MKHQHKEQNPIDIVIEDIKKILKEDKPIHVQPQTFYCPIHRGFHEDVCRTLSEAI